MGDWFIGEIRAFAYGKIPRGWLSCEGQTMQVLQNQALFSLLSNLYGGDGRTTFKLPDLRGRVPVAQQPGTAYLCGLAAGSETVALSDTQVPPHTHQAYGMNQSATIPVPGSNMLAIPSPVKGQTATPPLNIYANPTATSALAPAALETVGAGAGHDNMQPSLAIQFCIAISGMYPQRN